MRPFEFHNSCSRIKFWLHFRRYCLIFNVVIFFGLLFTFHRCLKIHLLIFLHSVRLSLLSARHGSRDALWDSKNSDPCSTRFAKLFVPSLEKSESTILKHVLVKRARQKPSQIRRKQSFVNIVPLHALNLKP